MSWRWRLLEGSTLAAEALWLYALLTVLAVAAYGSAGPTPLAFMLAALGGFYLSRLIQHLELPPWHLAIGALVLSAVGLYAILRLEYRGDLLLVDLRWLGQALDDPGGFLEGKSARVLGALTVAALWLRSGFRGQRPITEEGLVLSFTVGFVGAVLAALTAPAAGAGPDVAAAALAFFALGLFALGLSRTEKQVPTAGPRFRRWWATLPLTTVAVLLVAVGPIWLLASADVGRLFAPLGQGLAWLVQWALIITLTPVFIVLEWVLRHLVDLIANNSAFELRSDRLDFLRQLREGQEQEEGTAPEALLVLLRVVAALVVAAIVLGIFYLAFRRLRSRQPARDEVRESVVAEGGLKEDVTGLLGRLWSRLQRAGGEPDLPEEVLAIRRLYLSMLARAARGGLRRPPAKTPLEFAPALEEHFASPLPGHISHAFVQARYGLTPPPPAELERLRRQWQNLPK